MAKMNWDRKRRYDRVSREPMARPDQIRRLQELTGLPGYAFRGVTQEMCDQLIDYYTPKPLGSKHSAQPLMVVPKNQDSGNATPSVAAIEDAAAPTSVQEESPSLMGSILVVLERATRAMKAKELARVLSDKGQRVTKREVNFVLYRLERRGVVTRNPDYTWQIALPDDRSP